MSNKGSEQIDSSYVLNLLPKTDCKECGEKDCLTFAKKVILTKRDIEECPPLFRKRRKDYENKKNDILKSLKKETKLFNKEEKFIQNRDFGQLITRLYDKNYDPKKHIIITTKGLVLKDQPVYQLKKKWKKLDTNKNQKVKDFIDYKKEELLTGLIPFRTDSKLLTPLFSSLLSFDTKVVNEPDLTDNPWISAMTGNKGNLLIIFNKKCCLLSEKENLEKNNKLLVIDFPLNNKTKDSVISFLGLLDYITNRFNRNETLDDPTILKNLRKRYSTKFQLEESLQIFDKHITSDTSNQFLIKTKNTVSSPITKQGISEAKKPKKPKKKAPKYILWDTSHYETLRWKNEITELIDVIQKASSLKVKILSGSWADQLLCNSSFLKESQIIVLTGLGSKDKLSKKEIFSIKNFVKAGGGLFLSAPSFEGEDTNSLAKIFGVQFLWNKISDENHHEGKYLDHVLISNFGNHQLVDGVKEFCFGDYGGFPLEIKKDVISIAKTSESAQPPHVTVLAVTEYGQGSVVFVGSSTIFKDKYLHMFDNIKLAKNIFSFLSTAHYKIEKASPKKTKSKKKESTKDVPLVSTFVKPEPSEVIEEKSADQSKSKEDIISRESTKKASTKTTEIQVDATPKITSVDVEKEIDKLDEKLVFGEIDETSYEIEKIKLKKDFDRLNQLTKDGKINLSQFLDVKNLITSKNRSPKLTCSNCGEPLLGIEKFCSNCGEKIV